MTEILGAPHGISRYHRPGSNGRRMSALWGIMVHHTGSNSDGAWIDGYCARNPRLGNGLCCHAVVHQDGRIVLVASHADDVAWHAGSSMWAHRHLRRLQNGWTPKPARVLRTTKPRSPSNKRGGANNVMVGIELCTANRITERQYESALWLCATVFKEVNQREGTLDCRNRMMGHWEYTLRKIDPRLSYDELSLMRSRARNISRERGLPLWSDIWR